MLSFLLLISFSLIYLIQGIPKWHELESSPYSFEQYCNDFQKSYTLQESKIRRQIFEKRIKEHQIHNSNPSKTWKVGINQFTDQTDKEMNFLLGGRKSPLKHKNFLKKQIDFDTPSLRSKFPSLDKASIDWRTFGVITPVKDQGRCGSCWSFAAAETMESYYALAHPGELTILSQQQILDCTENPNQCGGTGGCGGATAELAYQQILTMGGLSSEWTYPYMSYFGDSGVCNMSTRFRPVAKISKFINLPPNLAPPIIHHLMTRGPLAVSVDAGTWGHYETGVFDGCNQTNPDLDHAVQLVGLGTDSKFGDYWLIRNSWTPLWGEDGYIRLKRTSTRRCGIDITPLDGDGCVNGSKTEFVCGTCGVLYDALYPVVVK